MELTSKPYLTVTQQLERLREHGLTIRDERVARQWLSSVGYYRLSGYSFVYRDPSTRGDAARERFLEGASFEDVVRLYEFDRKLRMLVHEGIERFEVMLQAAMSDVLGRIDPLCLEDARNFRSNTHWRSSRGKQHPNSFSYLTWKQTALGRINRAKNQNAAIRHHIENRNAVFPIWVVLGVADFADLSKLFDGLLAPQQHELLEQLDVRFDSAGFANHERHPFAAWLHQLSYLRNCAAHHSRVWNREFTPASGSRISLTPGFEVLPSQSTRVFGALTLLLHFVEVASPQSSWRGRLAELITIEFPKLTSRSLDEMGFAADWRESPLWASAISQAQARSGGIPPA